MFKLIQLVFDIAMTLALVDAIKVKSEVMAEVETLEQSMSELES